MLRGDNIICGTSTTGSGTLTLAACPSALAGIDPFVAFGSMGLGTANSVPMPYEITEYSDSTFATPVQIESGYGLLTLGASITGCTLARYAYITTTGLGTSPVYTEGAGTGGSSTIAKITIGTAANTLVSVGANSLSTVTVLPWYDYTSGSGDYGYWPAGIAIGAPGAGGYSLGTSAVTKNTTIPFQLQAPVYVRRAYMRVSTAQVGGTSNGYFRLYSIGINGKPFKLLIDLGLMGAANNSFGTAGMIGTAQASTGILLKPGGPYFADIVYSVAGSITTAAQVWTTSAGEMTSPLVGGPAGFNMTPLEYYLNTPTTGAAPDTYSTTGISAQGNTAASIPYFLLGAV